MRAEPFLPEAPCSASLHLVSDRTHPMPAVHGARRTQRMTKPANEALAAAVSRFGTVLKAKLSGQGAAGAPEDQLRAPLEGLLTDLADILLFKSATHPARTRRRGAAAAPIRYGHRSFDRQWIIPDARLINDFRPTRWRLHGPQRVYLAALMQHPPSGGPAATFTALMPDLHHYKGSFGGRVFPLWADPDASTPNIPRRCLPHSMTYSASPSRRRTCWPISPRSRRIRPSPRASRPTWCSLACAFPSPLTKACSLKPSNSAAR